MFRSLFVVAALAAGIVSAQEAPGRGAGQRQSSAPPCGGYFSRWAVAQPPPVAISGDFGGPVSAPSHGAVPIGSPGPSAPREVLRDPAALLVAAVVVAAALPLVVYSLDAEATYDVFHCWGAPTARFGFFGGTASTAGEGMFATRVDATMGYFGFEAGIERGSWQHSDVDAQLQLRVHPRQHVELAFAVGVRELSTHAGLARYLELSLPHRYYPFRRDAWDAGVSLHVRPTFAFSGDRYDVRLDGTLEVPIGQFVSLQLGARVYSMFGGVRGAALGGLTFTP